MSDCRSAAGPRRTFTIFALALLPLFVSVGCAGLESEDEATDSQSEELRRRRRRWECQPKSCADLGVSCGPAANGCGGTLDCGTCAPPPATTTPPPPPPPPPPPTSSGPWAVGKRPFLATSSWNTPIPAGATYTTLAWPASTGYNYWVNWEGYTPAIHVGTSADPLVQVSVPYGWGWPEATIPIRLPAGVSGAVGTDGEILMIDGTSVHNCWQFKRTSNTSGTCAAYARADAVTGTGWGTKSPFLGAGIVAAGASQLAGLLVQAETDAGEIEHALQIALLFELQKPNPVGEAISSDGSSASGISQEGERLALPAGMAMPSGLSPLGQKVFRAMQKYGVFNIDVAGCTTLRAQSNAYSGAVIEALRKDMNKLMPQLRRVTF